MSNRVDVFEGDVALKLFVAGRDSWNSEVESGRMRRVSFKGVDFDSHPLTKDLEEYNFRGFNFPSGGAYFNDAKFGSKRTVFSGVNFRGAANFSGASFGGDVFFSNIVFGRDFSAAYVTYKENVLIEGVEGAEGFYAYGSSVAGNYIFRPATPSGPKVDFKALNFSRMVIEGSFQLGRFESECVLDATYTSIGKELLLDGTKIDYAKQVDEFGKAKLFGNWPFRYKKAKSAEDSRCYRVLKKHAEEAKDHESALNFFASEMRCDYGRGLLGGRLLIYLMYDAFSNYGRSLSRPILGLTVSSIVFLFLYFVLAASVNCVDRICSLILPCISLAAAYAFPFSLGARIGAVDAFTVLYGNASDIVIFVIHILTMVQGIVCGAFLFLIGLALRNYFRS